jgi:branched-chain amino acid transport system substrate-binding protein
MKKFTAVLVFLSLFIIIPGLVDQAKGASKEPLRIGAVYPITGPLALLGEESWRGAEVARLMRNEKGGVAGRQIEFIRADAPDVSAARSEAERLVRKEDLKVLVGTYASSLGLAASEVTARSGGTYFEMGGVTDELTKRGYKNVFRTCTMASAGGIMQIRLVKEWLAPKLRVDPAKLTLAVAYDDSAYGSSMSRGQIAEAKKLGLKVVADIPYNSKAIDLSSVVLNLKKANPDIVILVSYANDSILLCRQGKELGFSVKAYIGSGAGFSLKSYWEALGPDAEGVFSTDFPQYEINKKFTPGLDEYIKRYKETFKETMRSGHSLANFVGAGFVFDILEKTQGNTEPDKVRQAAVAIRIKPGTTANGWGLQFDENGQNILADLYMIQWRNGKLVTVFPPGPAIMEPILATPCCKK